MSLTSSRSQGRPTHGARPPRPPSSEAPPMPCDHGRRFDDREALRPPRPRTGDDDPKRAAARAFGLPVILTASNPNGPNGPIFPELIAALPEVPVIERLIINSWKDPRFVDAVKKTGRKKLIMAGVSTDVCLTLPAVSAVRDGYDVYAVVDASGTFSCRPTWKFAADAS